MSLQAKSHHNYFNRFASNPARVIVVSFFCLIMFGTLLLMLPVSSRSGVPVSFSDALFTSTSASCVTGLVVQDTYSCFSFFGQIIIILLIQTGGLGVITFATFFNVTIRKKIGLNSLYVASESISSDAMSDMGRMVKMIFTITMSIEAIGALILATVFVPKYGTHGIFISIFLSISAYCNAGFDILGFEGQYTSLTNYASNPVVLITIMALIICGGLGFIVWQDMYHFRKAHKLALHTKIVLITTAILIVIGVLAFALSEWSNPATLGNMNVGDKILNSFFQSVTTRTAGFNSVDIASCSSMSKLWMIILMFIGAAPGGTAGGVKITTMVVLIMTVVSVIKGKSETMIGRRMVSKNVVYKALTVVVIAIGMVMISTATIFFTSHSGVNFKEIDSLFESVSAFGTVGLTSGVTGLANLTSRLVLIFTMFLGRVGPMSIALSLAMRPENKDKVVPEAKIMVG